MELPRREVWEILREKGVTELHHANSVLTSCSFLREGALLSRAVMQERGLPQTSQGSDANDKENDVWDGVFVDATDIHNRVANRNWYGPVMFAMNVSVFLDERVGDVSITRVNAKYFDGLSEEQRWFATLADLKRDCDPFDIRHQIVFRSCEGGLPLYGYLKGIVLDDPCIEGTRHFDEASRYLKSAMAENGLDVSVRKRACKPECECVQFYGSSKGFVRKMFSLDTFQLASARLA